MIYLAAGNSRRFGSNKLYADLNGKPMFLHGLEALEQVLCKGKRGFPIPYGRGFWVRGRIIICSALQISHGSVPRLCWSCLRRSRQADTQEAV